MPGRSAPMRRRLAATRGFSLVELLIAIMLIAVGVLALLASLDSSRELVSTSERHEAAVHQAEREIERILALDYDAVALTALPSASGDPKSPNHHVSGSSYTWDQDSTPRSDPLVVDAVDGALGAPSTWEADRNSGGAPRISGTVHRFVTWIDDPCCAGAQDAKRVTVAVTVDQPGGPAKPVLISSITEAPEE